MYRMALLKIFLIICIASFIESSLAGCGCGCGYTFDVMQYGAYGDGYKDDSKAFLKAWNATCGASGPTSIMRVPSGKTFLLKPLAFYGPCTAPNIQIQISGTLVAPSKTNGWSNCQGNTWIYFSAVDGLSLQGNGEINGQGSRWWKKDTYVDDDQYFNNYGALRFHKCNGLQLSGLSHVNSPRNHISINQCNGVNVSNLRITAPAESPNTDGIDISQSTNVTIADSNIETGDDCVAINTGCSHINITGVSCGPGHGISVGSLGAHGSYSTVEWIRVERCHFTGTMNGGRVKTWPASAVQVSNVYFSDVQGTSAGEEAITLDCSSHTPCDNITIEDVRITSEKTGSEVYSTCKNAKGTFDATPEVYCDQ
ncbi:pectin lyase-like superfamily protein [Actinidia rufa]|uniref:Pectin lyase-like superfamily protein n=1 Tax=Actinidia rufa TaxID=165716 RepID=A0A7J0GC24_9ERIC|nr:pectin lyase-like superfamily protein [Actinidia rufa]